MRSVRKTNSEVFICDKCGVRKRLDSSKRHWCDLCTHNAPVEMRPAKDKKFNLRAAPSVLAGSQSSRA